MAGAGYTVRSGELASAGTQVASLVSECEQVAGQVGAAIAALAGAAGDAEVESAARGAGESALKQLLNAGAGIRHTAQQLTRAASTYAKAESDSAAAVGGIVTSKRAQ